MSDDASHVYFDSREALDTGATAGQPNLYLEREGSISFIGTLVADDTVAKPGSISGGFMATVAVVDSPVSRTHASRVTPGGSAVVFGSASASLAASVGYDNADAVNGKASMEVYRYDANANGGEGQLSCISCNPSGARPVGQVLRKSYLDTQLQDRAEFQTDIWAAAWVQAVVTPLQPSRLLSEDGDRVFFNSFDALVPQDSNGAQDVYEWEAPGSGDCTTSSAAYSSSNQGCVSLVSSGFQPGQIRVRRRDAERLERLLRNSVEPRSA